MPLWIHLFLIIISGDIWIDGYGMDLMNDLGGARGGFQIHHNH